MNHPPLSILIVNWRSKDYLRRCLKTVRATCADLSPQIVVVDGGSFDGCAEMLAADFPEVEFVQSPENVGFGRSNNLGFSKVRGELLLLLNPDTELHPGAVSLMIQWLASNPATGIVGPRLLNTDGTLQVHCVRALPTPLNRALDSEVLRRIWPNSKLWGVGQAFQTREPVVVEAVSGACMLLRAEVFRNVGGFSPEFFMYGEDMDLCAKVRRQGLENVHVPEALVVHHGGGSTRGQVSHFSTEKMREAWATYMRLNHGMLGVLQYRLLQTLSAAVRITCLLPICIVGRTSGRRSARAGVEKWWQVLVWSVSQGGK